MKNLMKVLIVISAAVVFCDGKPTKSCDVILKTLRECHSDGYYIFFKQSTKLLGNTVEFHKNAEPETLKVHCLSSSEVNSTLLPRLNFSDVKTLMMNECHISNSVLKHLKANFTLSNVESLKINFKRKERTSLSPNEFESFNQVKNLTLVTNDYVGFSGDVLRAMKNLTTVHMDVHDITIVPAELFRNLTTVETIAIENSGDKQTGSRQLKLTLGSCVNLVNFRLSGVGWRISMNKTLYFNHRLKNVEIVNNHIEFLAENVFTGSSEIERLNLTHNMITTLPASIFASQSDLMALDLSFNLLETLPDDLFSENGDLESIDLSNNKLKVVNRKLFEYLDNLHELDLSHNKFAELNFETDVGSIPSLLSLLLSDNNIKKLAGNLQCTNLTRLDLSNNHLARFFVDQFLGRSNNSLDVILRENTLESVDFRNVNGSSEMARLNITIEDEIICNCHTVSLYNFLHRRLNVSETVFESVAIRPRNPRCIERGFDVAKTVMAIDKELVTCPLNFPHQVLCPASCYCARRTFDELLIIACVNITQVPAMPPYRALMDVTLNKIQLVVKGNGITRLPSKHIDLNYNDVAEIFASYNNIEEIRQENLPDILEILDLQFNRIKIIHPDLIAIFSALSYVQLSNNPWNCSDSTTMQLVGFVKTHRHIARDFNVVQCSDQRFFLEIDSDASCHSAVLIAVFLLLLFALVASIIFLYYRNREAISEWIFVHDKFRIVERLADKLKLFDAIIIATDYDKVFGKYVTTKLIGKPNQFKIGFMVKDWSDDEAIPEHVLKNLRNSRRAILVVSDHFEESDWSRWNHFSTCTRIIVIVKGKVDASSSVLTNQVSIQFSDPWFWDKIKHAMRNVDELNVDCDTEMQLIKCEG